MYPQNLEIQSQRAGRLDLVLDVQTRVEGQHDRELGKLLADLSPDTPWGERQNAAKKLGDMRSSAALPRLLYALQTDPFWMVRFAIIQALVMIADPAAVPTLKEVASGDSFQSVRSYARKAARKISSYS